MWTAELDGGCVGHFLGKSVTIYLIMGPKDATIWEHMQAVQESQDAQFMTCGSLVTRPNWLVAVKFP